MPTPISKLPVSTNPPNTADLLPIVQNGQTKQTTLGALFTQLLSFVQSGTGAVSQSMQTRIRKQPLYFTDYGGVADGVTDNTTAFSNFIAACVAQNRPGILDAVTTNGTGVFLMGPFTFSAAHSGLILEGQTFNPQGQSTGAGYFGLPSSAIKLNASSAAFITFDTCYNMTFRNMVFDGGGLAAVVHKWPGTANTTRVRFERCGVYGAVNATGKTIYFTGTTGGDSNFYEDCDFNGFPGGSSIVPLHHIHNDNSNAELIYFINCRFANAVRMFRYGAGSCSMKRCQGFGATTRFFEIDSTTQQFEIDDFYTEQTAVEFFRQSGSANVTGNRVITLKNLSLNHASNTIYLNCQQPVVLIGCNVEGIDITPLATYGTCPVIDMGVNFFGTAGYTGTGATTRLVVLGGLNSDGTSRAAQLKRSATNDSASAGYVGEVFRGQVASGSAVSDTGTDQWVSVTSFTLTPGDWSISLTASCTLNGATATYFQAGIGTADGNDGTGLVNGDNLLGTIAPTAAVDVGISVADYRVSISSNTTYYLKARGGYSAGGPLKFWGRMSARAPR